MRSDSGHKLRKQDHGELFVPCKRQILNMIKSRLITGTLTCHGCRVKREPWPHHDETSISLQDYLWLVVRQRQHAHCHPRHWSMLQFHIVWPQRWPPCGGISQSLLTLRSKAAVFNSAPATTLSSGADMGLIGVSLSSQLYLTVHQSWRVPVSLSLNPPPPGALSARSPGEWCAGDLGGMGYNMNTIMLSGEIMAS